MDQSFSLSYKSTLNHISTDDVGVELFIDNSSKKIVIIVPDVENFIKLQDSVNRKIIVDNNEFDVLCVYPNSLLFIIMVFYHLHNELLARIIRQYHTQIYEVTTAPLIYETVVDSYSLVTCDGTVINVNKVEIFKPILYSSISVEDMINMLKSRKSSIVITNLLSLELVEKSNNLMDNDSVELSASGVDPRFVEKLFQNGMINTKHTNNLFAASSRLINSLSFELFTSLALKYGTGSDRLSYFFSSISSRRTQKPFIQLMKLLEKYSDYGIDEKILLLKRINDIYDFKCLKYMEIELLSKYYNSENDDVNSISIDLLRTGLFSHSFPDMNSNVKINLANRVVSNQIYGNELMEECMKHLKYHVHKKLNGFRRNMHLLSKEQLYELSLVVNNTWKFVININAD